MDCGGGVGGGGLVLAFIRFIFILSLLHLSLLPSPPASNGLKR